MTRPWSFACSFAPLLALQLPLHRWEPLCARRGTCLEAPRSTVSSPNLIHVQLLRPMGGHTRPYPSIPEIARHCGSSAARLRWRCMWPPTARPASAVGNLGASSVNGIIASYEADAQRPPTSQPGAEQGDPAIRNPSLVTDWVAERAWRWGHPSLTAYWAAEPARRWGGFPKPPYLFSLVFYCFGSRTAAILLFAEDRGRCFFDN